MFVIYSVQINVIPPWSSGFRKLKVLTDRNQISKLLNTSNDSFIIYQVVKTMILALTVPQKHVIIISEDFLML